MKIRHLGTMIAFATFATASFAAGCGSTSSDTGTVSQQQDTYSDAQVAGIMDTVNSGEVQEGQAALGKAEHASVKDFAEMMVSEHTSARQRQASLVTQLKITPEDSPTAAQLKKESETRLSNLASKTGADFDTGYVEGQIVAHTKTLELIENTLLSVVTAPELKAELETARKSVAMHLEHAKSIREELRSAQSGSQQQSSTQGAEQSGSQSGQQTSSQGAEQSSSKSGEQTGTQSAGQSGTQSPSPSAEQSGTQSPSPTAEQSGTQSPSPTAEQSGTQSPSQSGEHSGTQSGADAGAGDQEQAQES